MKIEAHLIEPDLAIVTFRPGWIDRLFGEQTEERYAVRLPDIGGGYVWIFDSSGRRVPNVVAQAIAESVRKERKAS